MPPGDFWGAEAEGLDARGLSRNGVAAAGALRDRGNEGVRGGRGATGRLGG